MSAQADGGRLPRSGCFDLFTPLRSYAIPLCCPVERAVLPDMSCHMERRGCRGHVVGERAEGASMLRS